MENQFPDAFEGIENLSESKIKFSKKFPIAVRSYMSYEIMLVKQNLKELVMS